ncbi:response regulator transcription factor [Lachnoclostridium sp. Marseille-P6806]|uniref:response regulator transcription factor n=1 Tax=Lachnoclostridium sp. Marseille-P6806 TaxID=2364793 RepID=UPI001031B4E5|nr:response regulator [Lachnoclostridium sp. Marseille-P6806]
MTILIVEDEARIRSAIVSYLREIREFPCTLFTAESGEDAWNHYSSVSIDLIITDIRMQEMSGLALLERFHINRGRIRFIIISGYDDFSYAQQGIRLGVYDYLLKPINKSLLLNDVRSLHHALFAEKESRPALPPALIFDFDLDDSSFPVSLREIIQYIRQNYMYDISLNILADEFMFNPCYLSNTINKTTGHSLGFLLDCVRLRAAASLLLGSKTCTVADVSRMTGYSSERRLYQAFQKRLGTTPGEFRKRYSRR